MKDLTYKNLIQNNLGILVVDVTLTSQKLYLKTFGPHKNIIIIIRSILYQIFCPLIAYFILLG